MRFKSDRQRRAAFANMDGSSGVKSAKVNSKKTNVIRAKKDFGKKPKLGMDFHIYRIFQYTSDEGGGDRQEVAHVKANNIDDAIKFVKDYYFKKEYQKELHEEGDDAFASVDYSTAYDENGNELTEVPEGMEDEVNWVTEGFTIEEDDSEEEDFKTIYGGNDFFDVTSGLVKTKGTTTAQEIKKAGGIEKAFYSHAGKGFESGNPENIYNLNNPRPKLWKG